MMYLRSLSGIARLSSTLLVDGNVHPGLDLPFQRKLPDSLPKLPSSIRLGLCLYRGAAIYFNGPTLVRIAAATDLQLCAWKFLVLGPMFNQRSRRLRLL